MDIPCQVCGGNARPWPEELVWAGEYQQCPGCGGYSHFTSWMSYDAKSGKWESGTTMPGWVKSVRAARICELPDTPIIVESR